jgi:hypothetical protein
VCRSRGCSPRDRLLKRLLSSRPGFLITSAKPVLRPTGRCVDADITGAQRSDHTPPFGLVDGRWDAFSPSTPRRAYQIERRVRDFWPKPVVGHWMIPMLASSQRGPITDKLTTSVHTKDAKWLRDSVRPSKKRSLKIIRDIFMMATAFDLPIIGRS